MAVFVADASLTLDWCLKGEATSRREALLEQLRVGGEAIVPAHWPTEVLNGFQMGYAESGSDPSSASFFGATRIRSGPEAMMKAKELSHDVPRFA